MDAPLHLDILAAVRYLREHGAKDVSIIGGSMGAGAAGDASIASKSGEISCVVMLGGAPNGSADKLNSASPYIVARDDSSGDGPRLPRIREQYEKSPPPKRLVIIDGAAHAQALFETKDSERVLREVTEFLSANCTARSPRVEMRRVPQIAFVKESVVAGYKRAARAKLFEP